MSRPHVISASSLKSYEECPRARYYGSEWEGVGLEPASPAPHFTLGKALHSHLEWEIQGEKASEEDDSLDEESGQLIRALVIAAKRTFLKDFLEEYEILEVESPHYVKINDALYLYIRPDLVVRHKSLGLIYSVNWKSSSSLNEWDTKWEFDSQMWLETEGLNRVGIPSQGCIVVGFNKGGAKPPFRSPLVRGYKWESSYSYEYKRPSSAQPWRAFPTWKEEFPFGKGLEAWISWLPVGVVASQFASTLVKNPSGEGFQDWLEGVFDLESGIAAASDLQLRANDPSPLWSFRKKPSSRVCPSCAFAPLCWQGEEVESMISSGALRRRADSHLEFFKGLENGPQTP